MRAGAGGKRKAGPGQRQPLGRRRRRRKVQPPQQGGERDRVPWVGASPCTPTPHHPKPQNPPKAQLFPSKLSSLPQFPLHATVQPGAVPQFPHLGLNSAASP